MTRRTFRGYTPDQLDKEAQDLTNELWSVWRRREYETPGERKRALKSFILAHLTALNNMEIVDYANLADSDEFDERQPDLLGHDD